MTPSKAENTKLVPTIIQNIPQFQLCSLRAFTWKPRDHSFSPRIPRLALRTYVYACTPHNPHPLHGSAPPQREKKSARGLFVSRRQNPERERGKNGETKKTAARSRRADKGRDVDATERKRERERVSSAALPAQSRAKRETILLQRQREKKGVPLFLPRVRGWEEREVGIMRIERTSERNFFRARAYIYGRDGVLCWFFQKVWGFVVARLWEEKKKL